MVGLCIDANVQLFTNNNNLWFCAKSVGNNVEIIMSSHLRFLSLLEQVLFILLSLPFVFVIFFFVNFNSLAYLFVLVLFSVIFLEILPVCKLYTVQTYIIFHIEPFSGSMAHDIYLRKIHFCHREWIISIFISFLR